jgi:uncharacterized protein YcbX
MAIQLSEINVYPVKSLGGVRVRRASVDRTGLEHDRRWLVTDPSGRFFTQRDHPKMAQLKVIVSEEGVAVRNGEDELRLSVGDGTGLKEVVIWNDICAARDLGDEAAEWISSALETPARLVYMPDTTDRMVDARFPGSRGTVSFADAFPFLLIGEASLGELNSRLDAPLGMERFRPNFVVAGSEAFAEDGWRRIRIGGNEFNVVKPCARCVMTTIDQKLGQSGGKEPLRTMALFRRAEQLLPDRFQDLGLKKNDVLFGQNLVALRANGELRAGDEVEILD